jgi:hypothetical protein
MFCQGSAKPFVTVGHDMWDGKLKQINGVSIFIVHPATMQEFKIPVALHPPEGKTSLELCDCSWIGLSRISLTKADLFRAVNDNATPAVKTGKL